MDHRINDFFKIGTSTIFSNSDRNIGSNLYSPARQRVPLTTPFDENGNLVLNPGNDALAVNPLLDIDGVINEQQKERTFSSFYLEASLYEGMKFRTNLGIDSRTTRDGRFESSRSGPRNGSSALAEYGTSKALGYTLENILSYDKAINKSNRLGITLRRASKRIESKAVNQRYRKFPMNPNYSTTSVLQVKS